MLKLFYKTTSIEPTPFKKHHFLIDENYNAYKNRPISLRLQSSTIYYIDTTKQFAFVYINGNDIANIIINNFHSSKQLLLNYKSHDISILKSNNLLNNFLNFRLSINQELLPIERIQ